MCFQNLQSHWSVNVWQYLNISAGRNLKPERCISCGRISVTSLWAGKILGEEGGWGPSYLPWIRLTPSGHSELCDYSSALTVTPNPTTKNSRVGGSTPSEGRVLPGKFSILHVVQSLLSEQGPLMLPIPLVYEEDKTHNNLKCTGKWISHPGDAGLLEVRDMVRRLCLTKQTEHILKY